ncbi:DoxX family membrane protein [Olleya sp. Bg11-27]|uniref:DoxX family membrane protein n=1 Tax=Olleya sp. Bg11-27 TaxID=2058135 RepID=UPI000C305BE2|nr:DoxX family membrane protein [Olleya sp. Bg11-27]AUC76189.1 DoxX protein [Olleya sp. Bg11-27]
METTTLIIRLLLGLILVIFPINALFLKKFSPKMPVKAQQVMTTFKDTGYLLYLIQWTELIIGITLLTGFFVPLALLILVPISINILLFHIYLAPPILGPGLIIFAMNIFLLISYKASYLSLFQL